jgi:hypothetical protein
VLSDIIASFPGVYPVAARKHIDSGVAQLGPCMNGEMGLGNNDNPTDPLWTKVVKHYFPNFGSGA